MNTSSTSSIDKNATKHSLGKIVFTDILKMYTKSKQVAWKIVEMHSLGKSTFIDISPSHPFNTILYARKDRV